MSGTIKKDENFCSKCGKPYWNDGRTTGIGLCQCDKTVKFDYPVSEGNAKRPFVCPICNGTGMVTEGFYRQTNRQTSGEWYAGNNYLGTEMCKSCNGKGYVWEK